MISLLDNSRALLTAVAGIAIAVVLLPGIACAEISVRFTVETTSLFIYEPFTLSLEVESDVPPETPELSVVPDLAVTAVRRFPPDSAGRIHAFQIELIAERDGMLTVPPFPVRAAGEMTLTPALRLQVRSPRPATEMTLAITVEPVALRVGQSATVTLTWTSTVSFERCKQLLFQIPLLTDERCRIYPIVPPDPASESLGLPVNSIRMIAQAETLPDGRRSLSLRYKLVPRVPCVLRAPSARLVCALLEDESPSGQPQSYFYNHFFEATGENEAFEEVYLTAPVPEITVRALPEEGRNAHFADIVGPCEVRATVVPARLVAGQPALLTVHLDNLAFAGHIPGLPAAAFDGLRSEFQFSEDPIREAATGNTRSFTHILRPLRPGITRVPAIVIQAFDPQSDQYRTLRSDPIPVSVQVNRDDDSTAFAPRIDSQTPIQLHGVRHNHIDEQTMISVHDIFAFLGRFWWVFIPLPPLLWLALLPLVRRRERCRRDPVYARAVAAWWRFRRTAWRDEELAWRNYLADRLGLCAEALTADTVTDALLARKVDPELIAESRRRFEERDAADYGKRSAAPSGCTLSLVRQLHRVTVPLLLVFSLLAPSYANAADRAEELFSLAMQMREEKPDQAQPLFTEAALRFESTERFLNAGNSWFFAGENGRALANYRAAQRRAPFDRQLHESIRFLCESRADAFASSAASTGHLATFWTSYCTWTPRLRVGSFVLTYLLTWAIFLTTQFFGWRVRRTVWAVLLVAGIMPLISLAQTSFQPAEGVVIEDGPARLGPGYAYDPAFEQPLHKATEFMWMETRNGWVRARFPDASEGWLRETGCIKVE